MTGTTPRDLAGHEVECDDARDAHECPYCGRPFASADLLALHRGHAHPDVLTDDERAAFRAAYEDEQQAIREFRLKAIGLLVLVYFGFLVVYALV